MKTHIKIISIILGILNFYSCSTYQFKLYPYNQLNKKGEKTGIWIDTIQKDMSYLTLITYKNNFKNGPCISFHYLPNTKEWIIDGIKYYKNDKLHGKSMLFINKGKPVWVRIFKKGECIKGCSPPNIRF